MNSASMSCLAGIFPAGVSLPALHRAGNIAQTEPENHDCGEQNVLHCELQIKQPGGGEPYQRREAPGEKPSQPRPF